MKNILTAEIKEQLPSEMLKAFESMAKSLQLQDAEHEKRVRERIDLFFESQREKGLLFDNVAKKWIRSAYVPPVVNLNHRPFIRNSSGSRQRYHPSRGSQHSIVKSVMEYRNSRQ